MAVLLFWGKIKSTYNVIFFKNATFRSKSQKTRFIQKYAFKMLETLTQYMSHHWSKVPRQGNSRTTVESTEHGFWSPPGQKYQLVTPRSKVRIGIFGHRATKTGKKSRKKTLRTTDANYKVPGWHPTLCRVPPRQFRTFHQWCVKFLSRILYPLWPPNGRKFRFSTFKNFSKFF